jgi:hypothetical protein
MPTRFFARLPFSHHHAESKKSAIYDKLVPRSRGNVLVCQLAAVKRSRVRKSGFFAPALACVIDVPNSLCAFDLRRNNKFPK